MSRFDDAAATWDTGPKIERARRAAGLLRGALPLAATDRVLDLGAGTGQLSLHLRDAVGSVVVSDASTGMLAVAAQHLRDAGLAAWSTLQLDLTGGAGGLEQGSFDGIWSMLALHHIHGIDALLANALGLLRPGGWIAIIDLDDDPAGAFHDHVGDAFEGHHGFDRDALRRQLEGAGFEQVRFADAGAVEKEVGDDVRPFPMFLAIATRPVGA